MAYSRQSSKVMDHRKFTFLSLSQFIHHHLLWFLISAYAIAAVFPTAGLWIRSVSFGDIVVFQTKAHVSLLLVLLATLMFNAGLGVKTSHLKALGEKGLDVSRRSDEQSRDPHRLYLLCQPATSVLAYPDEAQHILVGLALVAAMPIAGASTAWAQNSNGNLALSLGLVLFSTLLSPIITPMAFYVFGEMASEEYETSLTPPR